MEARQLRLLGGLVAVLLLLTLAYNQLGEPEDRFDPDATEVVWRVTAKEVVRFELEREEGKLAFERVGKQWFMREPIDVRADNYPVNKLLTDLAHIDVGIPLPELKASDVKLDDPPRAKVRLTDAAGVTHSLTIGIDAPVGYNAYVLAPSGVVTAVDSQFGDGLHKTISHFRDKALLRFDAGDVRSVRITSRDGVLEVFGEGKVWWLDGFGRADASKVDDLIVGLQGLRYDVVQEGDPSAMADPTYEVLVATADTEIVLHIGDRTPLGQVAHVVGQSLGMVDPPSIALLGQGPVDVGDDHAIPAWPAKLKKVEVSLGGQGWTVEKSEEGGWLSGGEPAPDADAWLTQMGAAAVHYRREPVPAISEDYGFVTLTHTDSEPFSIRFGQLVDDKWRVAKDSRGGAPYLVPVDDVLAMAMIAAAPVVGDEPPVP